MLRLSLGLGLVSLGLLVGCSISMDGWNSAKHKVESESMIEMSAASVKRAIYETCNGTIDVQASEDTDQIKIMAYRKARGTDEFDANEALAAMDIFADREDDVIRVWWEWNHRRKHWSGSVNFVITQPSQLPVEVISKNGSLTVSSLDSDCRAETHNGRIEVLGCNGSWDLESRNGKITATGTPSELFIETRNGSVDIEVYTEGTVDGEVETANGSVVLCLADGADVHVMAETDNGSISPDRSFDSVHRSRRSFNGKLGSAKGSLSIETSNGSIRLRD